ncbi:FAD-binding oxidoreductase [Sphingomonas sp. ID1715]|uniref:FAD-binding oxidoreductase n=1 Tax=Sphingomonas sp. ID1715 TaxID=1656898 RepID=UPI001489D2D6|nr:FAD-binding oxidoreductase [Sphingomonas sp. ID1715]NNM76632.1 FAD-binding oxidoreductase [Sphingomonas sp. ID1715]
MTQEAFLNAVRDAVGPKGLVRDGDEIAPWTMDWRGRYRGVALALAAPADTGQVAAVVRLCAEHRVPIVPQGGNTSMVGGATPDTSGQALILSLRRLNRIRRLDARAGLAVAEAGVVLSTLHEAAIEQSARFPLSLGAKGSATIGGLCATNAGGTQVLRFGTMRSLVLGLEAVLPDGSVLDTLAPLKKDNRGPDLKQILIGAEGTLGIITAATLQLVPLPPQIATAWVGLASPQHALDLLRRLEGAGLAVESFELVPADSLALVLRHIPGTRAPLTQPAPWNALVEVTGGEGVRVALERQLVAALEASVALDAVFAENQAQAMGFWRIRESISEAERASGPAVQHDISIPVDAMPDFMLSAAAEVERRFPDTTVSAYGHLGDGNVHFHVRAPEGAVAESWIAEVGKPISGFVYDLVTAAGGSISAEHGIGQMKLAEFARLAEPARLHALRALKAAFDPLGIMNPGKLIPPSLASDAAAP